jgi:hypothetical protein
MCHEPSAFAARAETMRIDELAIAAKKRALQATRPLAPAGRNIEGYELTSVSDTV